MNSELVRRHDRDLRPITATTSDSGNWQMRVYARAEARKREADRETGRETLRDRIGVPRPPKTLRAKILARVETSEQPARFDVIAELRKLRAERERRERVRHS